jgi:hypothetical protein
MLVAIADKINVDLSFMYVLLMEQVKLCKVVVRHDFIISFSAGWATYLNEKHLPVK